MTPFQNLADKHHPIKKYGSRKKITRSDDKKMPDMLNLTRISGQSIDFQRRDLLLMIWSSDQVLQLADILGCRTFSALGYIKADTITLGQ